MSIRQYVESLSPSKSCIEITITKWGGTKRVKFINKKGTFQYREQCRTCQYRGIAQVGLGLYTEPTCDRDGETWRKMSGSTKKDCKLFKEREQQ